MNNLDICYLDWLALLAILGEERAKNTHPETILLLAPTDSPKASSEHLSVPTVNKPTHLLHASKSFTSPLYIINRCYLMTNELAISSKVSL